MGKPCVASRIAPHHEVNLAEDYRTAESAEVLSSETKPEGAKEMVEAIGRI